MTDLVVYDSPINPVAIRESTLGSYLESINTGNTWFQSVQETLGFDPKPLTALDALYATSGIAGMALLIPLAVGTGAVSIPILPVCTEQPFVMAIVGRRGSGKGHLCIDLLKHFYKGMFDFIVWISPTFQLQAMTLNLEDHTGVVVFSEWRPEIISSLYRYNVLEELWGHGRATRETQ